MDILAIIKSTNPEDITQRELDKFRLTIEKAQKYVEELQRYHRSLTGQDYVPPIRYGEEEKNEMFSLPEPKQVMCRVTDCDYNQASTCKQDWVELVDLAFSTKLLQVGGF
jgi:hypothetical protein